MKYSEIKREVRQVEKSLEETRRHSSSLVASLASEESEIQRIRDSTSSAVEAEKHKQLRAYVEEGIAPYEAKVASLSGKLSEMKIKREDELSKLSLEAIEKKVLNSDTLTNQIKAITESVEEKIISNVGERMFECVRKNLEHQDFSGSEKDVQISFKKLKALNKKIRTKNNDGKNFGSPIDMFDSFWGGVVSSDRTSIIFFYVLLLVVFVLFLRFVAPVFFVLLLTLGARAVQQNYLYYTALIECTKVTKNYDKIVTLKKQQAQTMFEKQQAEIKREYGKKIKSLESRLSEENSAVTAKALELQKNFEFDPSAVERQLRASIDVRTAKMEETRRSLDANKEEVVKLEARLNELHSMLDDSLALLKSEYLDTHKLGTDLECISEVLLDFRNDEPVFFDFKKASSFFVYKDTRDLISFIRLFITQIRTKMDSDIYTLDFWDSKMFGSSYLDMTTNEMPLLGLSITEDDIKEDLGVKTKTMMKRIGKVKRAYNSIFEYNDYLASIDSLVEPYNFIFCVEQNPAIFSNDAARSLLGEYSHISGMFVLFFISDEELRKNDKFVEIVDYFDYGYLMEHGEIYSKARDFIKRMYAST